MVVSHTNRCCISSVKASGKPVKEDEEDSSQIRNGGGGRYM